MQIPSDRKFRSLNLSHSLVIVAQIVSNLISKKKRFWGEENHCRRVYEKDGVYIKLWDVDYVRGSTIIEGFSSGFYDSFVIPNFMGLIVDDKMNCRGYVTKEITRRKGHYDEMLKIISQKQTTM